MSRLPRDVLSRKPFITIGSVILCSISLMICFGTILYVAHQSHDSRVSNCRAVYTLRDTVVGVLSDASTQTAKHKNVDPTAQQFYHRNIIKLQKVKCNA